MLFPEQPCVYQQHLTVHQKIEEREPCIHLNKFTCSSASQACEGDYLSLADALFPNPKSGHRPASFVGLPAS